jgi:hypothetical protein
MSVALEPSRRTEPPAAGPRPFWHALPSLFTVVALALIAANYFTPFADLDFTWQIRTGEYIARTGSLQPVESFSYTIAGTPVPEFEWLYEVLLWMVWSGFGFGGLKLLRVLLVAAPLVLLGRRLRREGVPWHGTGLALLTAMAVLAPSWNLRPMYCTTIGLLLVSGWLHDHCTGRRPLPWWLPVVMLLWGNLHPGVITGQGLLAGAIAWEWHNRRLRLNTPLDRAACWRLTLVGGLGLLATFVCPDPVGRLLYPFRPELAHPIQRIFSEMRPLPVLAVQPPFLLALAYVVAALVGLTVVLRFRQYRLWEVALLLGLAGLANVAVRSSQDWLLNMLALGVPHLAVLVREAVARRRSLPWPKRWPGNWARLERRLLRVERSCKHILSSPWMRPQPAWLVGAVAVLAILSLPPWGRGMPVRNGAEWPVQALDWAEGQGLHGRFFGPPDYGSYVGWRLGDGGRCYVDTRGFFFPPELIEDSHYVPQMGPDWRRRLERVLGHGTDYFLLETTGGRGRLWQALSGYVQPLYLDERTVLLRAEQVSEAVARIDDVR